MLTDFGRAWSRVIHVERFGSALDLARRVYPYGRVICPAMGTPVQVNQGRASRYDMGSLLHREGMTLAVALFEAAPSSLPFEVDLLEQHPDSEQLIMPIELGEDGWTVLVAPDLDGVPDVVAAIAIRLKRNQGFIYKAGVWHLPILSHGRTQSLFLVQSMQDGTRNDCIEHVIGPQVLELREPLAG